MNLHPEVDSTILMTINGVETVVSADDVEVVCTLGRGQYGQVDKVRHHATGFEFAVKVRKRLSLFQLYALQ